VVHRNASSKYLKRSSTAAATRGYDTPTFLNLLALSSVFLPKTLKALQLYRGHRWRQLRVLLRADVRRAVLPLRPSRAKLVSVNQIVSRATVFKILLLTRAERLLQLALSLSYVQLTRMCSRDSVACPRSSRHPPQHHKLKQDHLLSDSRL
jgi:hypothetical protein